MEGSTATMSELITDLTTVSTAVIGQQSTIAETIMANPLLLLTVGIMFFGGCIGIFGRLIRR